MSGRVYSVSFENISVNAQVDFFELTPGDDKPVEIVGLFFSQTGNSDVGDAAEELLRFQIIRGHTTGGSGGSAPTPAPIKRSVGASSFTAETNNTTIASAGTGVALHSDAFNVRMGYQNWWPEGLEPEASQADTTLVVRLMAAPADAITLSGTLYVRERG